MIEPPTDKKHYGENNYYLSEIEALAKIFHKRKESQEDLFDALNSVSKVFLTEIEKRYAGNSGPVNSLRHEMATDLIKGKIIGPEYITSRIEEAEEKSGKRSFKSYDYFSIVYPFFHYALEFNVKEALTHLSSALNNILDLVGKTKIHSVDFWGSRGFGDERVWTAIYNASHRSQQTAKQLFININYEGVWCGLYDRVNEDFLEELKVEISESTISEIVDFFEPYRDEIINDSYESAKFLPIGSNGSKFFKLSHGTEFFKQEEIQACLDEDIVVVHKDTKPKARTPIAQYKLFEDAKAGDLFYCCWGNNQFLILGQFIDDKVRDYSLQVDPDGWKERSYRVIQQVQLVESYRGIKKWWTPNDPSTFIEVPVTEYEELNKYILRPYFHSELDPDRITLLPQERVGVSSQQRIKVLDHTISPKLDVKIVAKEFANIVDNLEENKGQMLGIFGSWGRGKTFFVDQLKKEFEPKENDAERYINLTFNAWKYQETEAIWAYLYEVVLNAYLTDGVEPDAWLITKKLKNWWRTFSLNIKRKGLGRLISIFFGLSASIIITYGISSEIKEELVSWVVGAVGVIGLIQGYRIYKKYYQGIKDVLIDYSSQHNYKAVLGIQAEIQEELIILLKNWLNKKDERRILLFVDDLDRCSEDKIIRIIDALRVMLDDDYLVSKLLILVAVDELLLERAIKHKYKEFDPDEKDLVKEYMDKLFIGGIKFPGLLQDEQAVILETYAVDGNILEKEKGVEEELKPEPVAGEVDEGNEGFTFPEPTKTNSKVIESEFFLLKAELENLQSYSKELGNNITPRALRIYMYRYLLSKNLASAYMSANARFQLDDELCDFIAKAIAIKSKDSAKVIEELEGYDQISNSKMKDFIPKLVEMVVPY